MEYHFDLASLNNSGDTFRLAAQMPILPESTRKPAICPECSRPLLDFEQDTLVVLFCDSCKQVWPTLAPADEINVHRVTHSIILFELIVDAPLTEIDIADYQRRYRSANREKVADHQRRYRSANREKVADHQRRYRSANREKVADQQRRYRSANREKVADQQRRYYAANREKVADYQRRYYAANREKVADQKRRYYAANREKVADYQRRYYAANREKVADQKRSMQIKEII